jgi:hypothetical protein
VANSLSDVVLDQSFFSIAIGAVLCTLAIVFPTRLAAHVLDTMKVIKAGQEEAPAKKMEAEP